MYPVIITFITTETICTWKICNTSVRASFWHPGVGEVNSQSSPISAAISASNVASMVGSLSSSRSSKSPRSEKSSWTRNDRKNINAQTVDYKLLTTTSSPRSAPESSRSCWHILIICRMLCGYMNYWQRVPTSKYHRTGTVIETDKNLSLYLPEVTFE